MNICPRGKVSIDYHTETSYIGRQMGPSVQILHSLPHLVSSYRASPSSYLAGLRMWLSYLLHTPTINMFVIKTNHKAAVWSPERVQTHFMGLLLTNFLCMNQVGAAFEYCSSQVSKPATWKCILFSFQL